METYCTAQWTTHTLKLLFRVGDLNLPEIRKMYASSRLEEEDGAQSCPCGYAEECRTHTVGDCAAVQRGTEYRYDRCGKYEKNDGCDTEKFGTLQ